MKNLRVLLITMLYMVLLTGCGTSRFFIKDLGETYPTVVGRMAAPPSVEGKRLFLYLRLAPEEGSETMTIKVCVTENREKEAILARLADSLVKASEVDKPVYIIGKPVDGEWQEFAEGIDFEVYAVSYWEPRANSYHTVITTYGNKVGDLLSSISWSNFLQSIGKKAIDAAL